MAADAEEAFLHHHWVNSYPQALAILLLVNTLDALDFSQRPVHEHLERDRLAPPRIDTPLPL
jgi:hypothetical protein